MAGILAASLVGDTDPKRSRDQAHEVRRKKRPPGQAPPWLVKPDKSDSSRCGHFLDSVAGQDFGLGAQPILFVVPVLAATFFVEFVGALPNFCLESVRVRGFHRYLPYK